MKRNGFTLIELMVALFIFGMLAAASVALLSFSVRAQASAAERLDRIAAERRLSALLAADLGQALPRLVRDASGGTTRAFTGTNGQNSGVVMGYVRGGWTNPDEAPRSSVQRVEIALVDGRLERRAFAMTDGAPAGAATVLADNVESVRLRYRDRVDWRAIWADSRPEALPKAVELIVKREGDAPLLLAFLVATTYP